MRKGKLVCDWCETEVDEEDELPDWIGVELFDTMKEEYVVLDFCSLDCLKSHFG